MKTSRRGFMAGLSSFALAAAMPSYSAAQAEVIAIWVGTEMAKGAAAYVGGQLLAAVLGGTNLSDVKGWIRAAVAELEQFVSNKLDEVAIAELASEIQAIHLNLVEYAALDKSNQAANRFLIDNANIRTAAILHRSYDFTQAFEVSVGVMALRVMAIKAAYDLDGDKGHITAARSSFDGFLKIMNANFDTLSYALTPQNRILYADVFCDGTWRARAWLDNVVATDWGNVEPILNHVNNVLGPPVVRKYRYFVENGSAALFSLMRTFDQMFTSAGEKYVSPVGASFPLGITDYYTVSHLKSC